MRIILIFFSLCFFFSCRKDIGKKQQPSVPINQTTQVPIDTIKTVDTIKPPVIGLEIGNKAPEIKLKDSTGVYLSLSSLKNKVVLVDFWAAWCDACIYQNRNLVSVYARYKDTTFKNCKGFDIYGVSLDSNKKLWIYYMSDEKYKWKCNVLDTSGSASAKYGINFLPNNFLIDENGIILAKNLRDSSLEKTLIKLLK